MRKDYDLHFTGKKIGGAVSLVMALLAKQDGFKIARVVTFNQPEVINKEYVAHLSKSLNYLMVADYNNSNTDSYFGPERFWTSND